MQKKRRFVRNVFASLLATLTAFSPALSVIPVYADEEDDGIKVQKSDDGIQVSNSDKKTVAIDIDGVNGELVLDAGKKDEQTVRVSDAKDENGKEIKKASITDADGNITEAEVNSDNPHAIVLTEETGKVVTVQAKADAGFEVAQYKILMDSGTKSEDTGFDANKYSAFTYDITFDADKTVTVGFKKADEGIKLESNVSDITVEKDTETSDDVKVEKDDDVKIEKDTEETTEKDSEKSDDVVIESADTPDGAFASVYLGDVSTDDLNAADFASMRLLMVVDDASVIVDTDDIIGQYGNIYMMQYTSIQQAMNAYAYYKDKVTAVEPDKAVEAATEEDDIEINASTSISMNESENPIDTLNDMDESAEAQKSDKVIALIDTGAKESENVIDRVSVIDDSLDGNGHADEMVKAIVNLNADAKILSIRAMDDKGFGTASSIVSAMEYAINQKVSIINLSLYAKTSLSTSVLEYEVKKAQEAGIMVVGAAGNDGANVADYMPGSIEEAYIIGAADEKGARIKTSNYGSTVDYNVVAGSTSEAAAKFTGFISVNGIEGVAGVLNQGLIYATDYANSDIVVDDNDDFSKYTLDESKDVHVVYTIIDGSKVGTDINLDDLFYNKDGSANLDGVNSLIMSKEVSVKVYAVGDGTYKFKMNAPLLNGYSMTDTYPEVDFGNANLNGEIITDGVSFDAKTGVATVSESALEKHDGDYANLLVQAVVPVNGIDATTTVNATFVDSNGKETKGVAKEVGNAPVAMKLNIKGSDADLVASDFDVYVDGQKVDAGNVSYDSETSVISVNSAPAGLVSEMKVVCNKQSDSLFTVAAKWTSDRKGQYKGMTPSFWLKDGTDTSKLKVGATDSATSYVYAPDQSPGFPNHGPSKTLGNASIRSMTGYDGAFGTLFGWIGIPTKLFGVDFTYTKDGKKVYPTWNSSASNINCAIPSWCHHLARAKKHDPTKQTVTVNFRIVDAWESNNVKYYALGYVTEEPIANARSSGQYGGGVIAFAVKDSTVELEVSKVPDTTTDCWQLMYKHGRKPEGLLAPYQDLTTTFSVWTVQSDGKTPNKKLGSFTTNKSGKFTINSKTVSWADKLEKGTKYVIVEDTAPKNYLNAHAKTNPGIEGRYYKGPVVFTASEKGTVEIADPGSSDPQSMAVIKHVSGRTFDDMSNELQKTFDFSTAEFEMKYYAEKTDGTFESNATYTFKLKPILDGFGNYRYWSIDISDKNCYADGTASFLPVNSVGQLYMPIGKYVIHETQAPVGFKTMQDMVMTISYSNGSQPGTGQPLAKWVDYNTALPVTGLKPDGVSIVQDEDTPWMSISVEKTTKVVLPGTTLEGVEFAVYNDNKDAITLKNYQSTKKVYQPGEEITEVRMTIEKDANGKYVAKTPNVLPYGSYSVKEVKGNDYYPLTDDTKVEKVTFSPSENPQAVDMTKLLPAFTNIPVFGGFSLQKVDWMKAVYTENGATDHGNANLAGAQFAIIPVSDKEDEDMLVANDVMTGADISSYEKMDATTKVVKSTSLPTSATYDQLLAAYNAGHNAGVVTTDRNGNVTTSSTALAYGRYYIIEIKAPEGYEINKNYLGVVDVAKPTKTIRTPKNQHPATGDDVNELIYTAGLKVKKIDYERDLEEHGDASLAGAEFTIVNASKATSINYADNEIKNAPLAGTDVTYSQVLQYAKDPSYVMETITTDKNGNAQTSKHTCPTFQGKESLPYGTYYVIETKAPEGYFVNTTWVGMVTVTAKDIVYTPTVIQGKDYHRTELHSSIKTVDGDEYGTRDQIWRSGVRVFKTDLEMKDATPQGDATLKNATFRIINISDAPSRNYQDKDIPTAKAVLGNKRDWKSVSDLDDKYTMQRITTDEQGVAQTAKDALPYGTYLIVEEQAPDGYLLNGETVARVVVRDDNKLITLGDNASARGSVCDLVTKGDQLSDDSFDDAVRRGDLWFLKVNIDGEYKQYIPFLISHIRVNEDGSETVTESHVIVCDENGLVNTARGHSNHTNEADKYLIGNSKVSATPEQLKEASKWGVWFQGNDTDYQKDSVRDDWGALYEGYYKITELQCDDNKDLEENLLNSSLIYVTNDSYANVDRFLIKNINQKTSIYHPLVDTEIEAESKATDVESDTQTVPVRDKVYVNDWVRIQHISSDHKYRIETKFVDLTTGKTLKLIDTDDKDCKISDDKAWVTKEFKPAKKSGTNNTWTEQNVSASISTKGLEGHTIMAYDYLYQYIDISDNDLVKGDWVLVKIHPEYDKETGKIAEDDNQKLYVADIHTNAVDKLSGDRVGVKSKDDAIVDTVSYMNLSKSEEYVLVMTPINTKTGKPLETNADGSAKTVQSPITFRRAKTPVSGKVTMPEYKLDSSKFENGTTVTIREVLYRAAEDGSPMGDPIVSHDSLLDEDQTIRWIDVYTTASDKNTKDDVGTDEKEAVVYDTVKLSNVIFDDNDHDGGYTYTLKGKLVYQKDFTDANGKAHKAGETVDLLENGRTTVTIKSDAAGNISFTYEDGTKATGSIVKSAHGYNVAKSVDKKDVGNNAYVSDPTAMYCDLTVELQFKVNSEVLAGGTVVVFEDLYHDSTNTNTVVVASHSDINDEGQTVHYPDVKTSAIDNNTKDDVGARLEHEKVVDTVKLTNLVPGRDYVINGTLMNQKTGEKMMVNGKDITQSASIHVTEDGKIIAGHGEKATVTDYNAEKHEVSGTVDLTFEFDSRLLGGETVVVFEDLIHNGVKVATHSDLKDKSQTVHFPEIHTSAIDGYTKDEVGTVAEKATVVDTVYYDNLVPGREYTITGTLMNQRTGEVYLDADGKEVTVTRTFEAGKKSDGITVKTDEEHNSVSGTIEMTFNFNGTNLEDTTLVVFENLYHNNIKVTAHADLKDKSQTVHFPKIRTSAIDVNTGDEVGVVGKTQIRDTVRFWNLVPTKDYTIKGKVYDKTTGKFLTDESGKDIEAENSFHINEDGTVDNCCTAPCHCKGGTCTCEDWAVCISEINKDYNHVNGHTNLVFNIDATDLAGHDLVVFEYLYHNDVIVAEHADENDLNQTIHMPEIKTTAADVETSDNAGTVAGKSVVRDTVHYKNLVVGREYTLKGTLMNQETGAPVLNEDGSLGTAEATFTATEGSDGVNTVKEYNEKDNSVSGDYVLEFTVDSTQLVGKTVVAFEDLYHNGVKVHAHADLFDKDQSVHYPDIHTTAIDSETGDHVGSIFGSLINGVRHLFGDKDADGNDIPDSKQQNIIDTVTLNNLVPGYTYVVSGKLYDVEASKKAGTPVALTIDGKEVTKAVTITVAEDGKSIKAADGSETSVTKYHLKENSIDGTVKVVFELDSSKAQGTKVVVFEDLYQDSTYTPDTNPDTVDAKDIIYSHSNIDDENQSVSEVGIHTTAIDTKTEKHVGVIPSENEYSVLKDEVNLTKLVPGARYVVEGVLVDINASDFKNGKIMYLTTEGTLTEDRAKAYKETTLFAAKETDEVHYLNFGLTSDMVQGRALTVFEDVYHNEIKISSHPAKADVDKWDEASFQNQTVYYPTGKTNATDNTTGNHTSYASGERTVADRVYFENFVVGENYEIDGQLVYQSDFTDSEGVVHKAGDPVDGAAKTVKFTASDSMVEVAYADSEETAKVDSLNVTTLPNGQKVVSGYVPIEFKVDASKLSGATLVAFETFKNNDVTIFDHSNLKDLPQTVRIPEIHTNAKVGDLDEASVHNEDGSYAEIKIVDTVTYKNVWTQAELDEMHEQGKAVRYADGTYRVEKSDIYDIKDKATYVMKGVLMNKETGETLKNVAGEEYVVYSEPFSPESNDGSVDVEFTVNAADFVKDDKNSLEALTVVAFEDLYQVESKDDVKDDAVIASHKDIDDAEQDIRFPEVRTHAFDGIESDVELKDGQMLSLEDVESLSKQHESEKTTTGHEVYATDDITITDYVSVRNLHGATKYTVKGTLQVLNGDKYEAAKDDEGNEITSTVEFDTTSLSDDYNASVSGYVPVTFKFSGKNLAGKTTVAFETLYRDGVVIGVHADIEDGLQTVYLPAIHTNASDLLSGLNETLASSKAVILDKVSYENLEYGKTYTLSGTLHKKSDGSVVEGTAVEGTFVAGTDNQFIFKDGTKVMALNDVKAKYNTSSTQSSWDAAVGGNTTTGSNEDKSDLDISDKTEYVVGRDIPAGYYKITPVDNGYGQFGYWCIYTSKDTKTVPAERTLETTLTNGIVTDKEPVNYIRLADNMVLQIANNTVNGKANAEFVQVSAEEAELNLNKTVKYFFDKLNASDSTVSDAGNTTPTETPVEDGTETTIPDADAKADVKGDASKRVSGEVYVVMEVNAEDLGGETLVAFESLSASDDNGKGKVIATHEDINDEDQSVNVPVIQTSATIDGAKSADASKDSTVVDTVSYHNLVPGREYEMRGVLMDKSTGKSTGVTAVQKFTPDKADGTVEITFKIDTTAYVGRQLVVFEELVSNDENGTAYVVAQHKDINDAAQTVTVTNPPEDKVTPSIDTSDFSTIGYVIGGVAMVLLLAGLAVLRKKKFHA